MGSNQITNFLDLDYNNRINEIIEYNDDKTDLYINSNTLNTHNAHDSHEEHIEWNDNLTSNEQEVTKNQSCEQDNILITNELKPYNYDINTEVIVYTSTKKETTSSEDTITKEPEELQELNKDLSSNKLSQKINKVQKMINLFSNLNL